MQQALDRSGSHVVSVECEEPGWPCPLRCDKPLVNKAIQHETHTPL